MTTHAHFAGEFGHHPNEQKAQQSLSRAAHYAGLAQKHAKLHAKATSDVEQSKHALAVANAYKKVQAKAKTVSKLMPGSEHVNTAVAHLSTAKHAHESVNGAASLSSVKQATIAKMTAVAHPGGGSAATHTPEHTKKLAVAAATASAKADASGTQADHEAASIAHTVAASALHGNGDAVQEKWHSKEAAHHADEAKKVVEKFSSPTVAAYHAKKLAAEGASAKASLSGSPTDHKAALEAHHQAMRAAQTATLTKAVAQHKAEKLTHLAGSKAKTIDSTLPPAPKPTVAAPDKASQMMIAKNASVAANLASKKADKSEQSWDHASAKSAHVKASIEMQKAGNGPMANMHATEAVKHENLSNGKNADGSAKAEHLVKTDPSQKNYDRPKLENSGAAYHSHVVGTQQDLAVFGQERETFSKKLTGKETEAIMAYSGSAYGPINNGLRKGEVVGGATKAYVQAIDTAINKHPATGDFRVLRGVSDSNLNFFGKLKVGDSFKEHGYSSASVSKPFPGNVKIHITVPKGHPAAPIPSNHPHEEEVLLPRGTKFHVTKIEPNQGSDDMYNLHVHVRVVAD